MPDNNNEKKSRDWFDFADLILKTLVGIAVPIAIAYSGMWIATAQKYRESSERSREQLLNMVDLFASCDSKKFILGVALFEYMKGDLEEAGRTVPLSLWTAVAEFDPRKQTGDESCHAQRAVGRPSSPTSSPFSPSDQAQANASSQSPALSPSAVRQVERVLTGAPFARLYVQIASEDQRASARAYELAIESIKTNTFNLVVPGIERAGKPPSVTEVRYTRDEDQAEAQSIAAETGKVLNTPIPKIVKVAGGNARPRHFEIWFASGPIPAVAQ